MASKLERSCHACRERHVKCSKTLPCKSCRRFGLFCEQASAALKFRLNKLPFPDDQTWLRIENQVTFVDGSESLNDDVGSLNYGNHSMIDAASELTGSPTGVRDQAVSLSTEAFFESPVASPAFLNDERESRYSRPDSTTICVTETRECCLSQGPDPPLDDIPRRSVYAAGMSPLEQSSNQSQSSENRLSRTLFPLSRSDAFLVRHFFAVLAIWFDYCDSRHQFAVEVSQRLPHSPALLYAVLAVASRHLSIVASYDSIASEEYHQKCLELLIPQLTEEGIVRKEDILAGTVILRLRAEFEAPVTGFDDQSHLLGTQALLRGYEHADQLSKFQRAAAWIGLRQEIRIAFLAQSGVTFPLRCLEVDFSLSPEDYGDWANRMVYHLADTLNYCCGGKALAIEDHEMLINRGENWMERRPPACAPVYYEDINSESRFPRYEFMNDAAATGTQHYHLSKILLSFYHPVKQRLGPNRTAFAARMDANIENSTRDLCGVGLSNSGCACAVGLACMGIALCGDRFQDEKDQEVFSDILTLAKTKHAWQM